MAAPDSISYFAPAPGRAQSISISQKFELRGDESMKLSGFVFAAAFIGLSAMPAQARVDQRSTECLMSIVGADSVDLSMPAQVHEPGFAVQMKDAQGSPLSGMEVWFFVNAPLQNGLVPPGTPPLPPVETYGRLGVDNFTILTDQEGIARSGPFIGGTLPGSYDVAAYVWVSGVAANAACGSSFGPIGYFRVNQQFRASAGTINGIPTLSGFAPWLLGLIVLGIGLICTRRAQGG
jgi:hypothetical protein